MRAHKILAAAASFVLLAAVCVGAAASPSIFKSNVRTASHVPVTGVPVMIVPPAGSVPATSFRGFEDVERGLKVEAYVASSTYEEVLRDIEQTLARDGITITSRSEAVINGGAAMLFSGSANDGDLSAAILIIKSDQRSVVLSGLCPSGDAAAMSAVRASLLSVYPSQAGVTQRSGSGVYRLDTSGTKFAFAGETNFTRSYRSDDGAEFTASYSTPDKMPTDRKQFAVDELGRVLSDIDHEVTSARNITLGGLPGVEVTASFSGHTRRQRTASGGRVNRQVPGAAYVAVLFDTSGGRDRTFILAGLASGDAEANLAEFKRIASTFRLEP